MDIIDILGDNRYERFTRVREACRGIVIDGDHILLSYEVNTDQWFIPGGGVEDGEGLEACCARELAEETGYIVDPKIHYLTIHEYYEELFGSGGNDHLESSENNQFESKRNRQQPRLVY